jgi:hypothetical protein
MTDDEHTVTIVREAVRLALADFFDIDPDDNDARRALRGWVGRLVRKYKRGQQWAAVMPIELGKVLVTGLGSAIIAILGWIRWHSQ